IVGMGHLHRTLALLAVLALGCSSGGPGSAPSASPSVPAGSSATPSRTGGATPHLLRPGPPRLRLVGRFTEPVYVVAPAGDRRRLFVVERAGRVVVLVAGRPLARPFLDIRDVVSSGGERGLLSLAFSARFAADGL